MEKKKTAVKKKPTRTSRMIHVSIDPAAHKRMRMFCAEEDCNMRTAIEHFIRCGVGTPLSV